MQNTFNLKVYDHDHKYPKTLLKLAWKWFVEEAEALHVDTSFFKYAAITQMDDVTWQVDFYDNPDPEKSGAGFSLYEIYFDGKTRKILQATFGLTQ